MSHDQPDCCENFDFENGPLMSDANRVATVYNGHPPFLSLPLHGLAGALARRMAAAAAAPRGPECSHSSSSSSHNDEAPIPHLATPLFASGLGAVSLHSLPCTGYLVSVGLKQREEGNHPSQLGG